MKPLTAAEKELLVAGGFQITCRCPKPCAQHSSHYRAEYLAKASRSRRVTSRSHDTLGKLRLAAQWVGDQIDGEMIEQNKGDGFVYRRDHLGFPSIAQWELDFICAGINNLLLGMNVKQRLDNVAGEFRWVTPTNLVEGEATYDRAVKRHRFGLSCRESTKP